MHEIDVTVTDYILALECLVFSYLFYKNRASIIHKYFAYFFISLSLAAFIGGTVHGFFPNENSIYYKILWKITLMLIGVTSLVACLIASKLKSLQVKSNLVYSASTIYVFIVTFICDQFYIAIIAYLPSILFLLISFITLYKNTKLKSVLKAIISILLTVIASIIQQLKIAIHPIYFNHNSLYHLIEFIALLMLFKSVKQLPEIFQAQGEIQ
jgi:hypothetical protein